MQCDCRNRVLLGNLHDHKCRKDKGAPKNEDYEFAVLRHTAMQKGRADRDRVITRFQLMIIDAILVNSIGFRPRFSTNRR